VGGVLAEPKTQARAEMLTSLAMLQQTHVGVTSWWIGLTDQGHEGSWVWQHSTEEATYTNWADGHPTLGDYRDCGIMEARNQFQWEDVDCLTVSAYPICERVNGSHSVELRDGDEFSYGNVYVVNSLGNFGALYDNSWDYYDAEVVCGQLGFFSGTPTFNSYFGDIILPYSMWSTGCSGQEEHIQDCSPGEGQETSWSVSEGAGVRCFDANHVELQNGDGYSYGDVYAVNSDGYFGPIYYSNWGENDANVVCRQLGYTYGTPRSHFGTVVTPYSMTNVECIGTEDSVQDCTYSSTSTSSGSYGSGVTCHD